MKQGLQEGTSNATQSVASIWKLVETRLAATSLEVLGAAAGISDASHVSKVRSSQLGCKARELVAMLSAAGLRVVSADAVCVNRARYEALLEIATAAMADPEIARRLTLDE